MAQISCFNVSNEVTSESCEFDTISLNMIRNSSVNFKDIEVMQEAKASLQSKFSHLEVRTMLLELDGTVEDLEV